MDSQGLEAAIVLDGRCQRIASLAKARHASVCLPTVPAMPARGQPGAQGLAKATAAGKAKAKAQAKGKARAKARPAWQAAGNERKGRRNAAVRRLNTLAAEAGLPTTSLRRARSTDVEQLARRLQRRSSCSMRRL